MKFINTIIAAALIAVVAGVPASAAEKDTTASVEVENLPPAPVPGQFGKLHVVMSAEPMEGTAEKVKRDGALAKRGNYITAWKGTYQTGAWTSPWSEDGVCYNWINGWSNAIKSIYVPAGHICYFYDYAGCGGDWVWIRGAYTLNDLGVYNFNNRVSSYICYLS